jgi:MtN3 and saliva related transmembrane protein
MIASIELLGYTAAVLTTVAFVPQVVLVYKTKDTDSISLLMFLIFSFGLFCWMIYGVVLNQLPIILANALTIFLSLYILYMKITEKRRKNNGLNK